MQRREIQWTDLTEEMLGKSLRIDYAPGAWMAGVITDIEYRVDEVYLLHIGQREFAYDTNRGTRVPKLTLLE